MFSSTVDAIHAPLQAVAGVHCLFSVTVVEKGKLAVPQYYFLE